VILLLASRVWACPTLSDALDVATAAIVDGPPTAAEAPLQDAAASFDCAVLAPEELARYWLVQGSWHALTGDGARAVRAYAAARRLAPERWDERFGASLRITWAGAGAEGPGWLTVDTNRASTRIDGLVPSAWPAEVAGGVHVVQVVAPDGATVWYGKVVRVAEGEEVAIETGLPESTLPPPVADPLAGVVVPVEPTRTTPRRSPWWLVASGVAAAGAGGLYWLAVESEDDLDHAQNLDQLHLAWLQQRGAASGAILLSGATAFGVVGYFAF
jgi:hypothetical protein